MSEAKKWNTTDPILLEALNAPDSVIPPKASRKRTVNGSSYRGISKKGKNGRWRAEIGANGKDYSLGEYDTDHEAALARNYGEGLVEGAKRVNNQIPPEAISVEVQKQVAAEVTARLRGYGVLPPVEGNGQHTPEVAAVPPATPPAQVLQPTDHEAAALAEREKIVKEIAQKVEQSRKGA